MKTETLQFEIVLHADYKFLAPVVEIAVNENVIFNSKLKIQHTTITSTQSLKLGKTHSLKIKRSGKNADCPEQTCKVIDIKIDNISVRDLVYHTSLYYPEYPEPWATEQKESGIELEYPVFGETIFGHNGVWCFEFSSPFYQYLINKVKGQ
jgi:hypothetical protein